MQRNPVSIITKTDQYQIQDITFPQVKWKFVSPVQTGVKFCAIKKPSCVMDSHFITYHRRLCPTAFSLDNLRKIVSNVKMTKTKSSYWTSIPFTQMHALSPSIGKGFAGLLQLSGNRLTILSTDEHCCKRRNLSVALLNWQQLAPAYRSLHL